jgi:hypothetical protein
MARSVRSVAAVLVVIGLIVGTVGVPRSLHVDDRSSVIVDDDAGGPLTPCTIPTPAALQRFAIASETSEVPRPVHAPPPILETAPKTSPPTPS